MGLLRFDVWVYLSPFDQRLHLLFFLEVPSSFGRCAGGITGCQRAEKMCDDSDWGAEGGLRHTVGSKLGQNLGPTLLFLDL